MAPDRKVNRGYEGVPVPVGNPLEPAPPGTAELRSCDAYIDLGTEDAHVRVDCERIGGHDKQHVASVFGFTGPGGGARSADLEWMT